MLEGILTSSGQGGIGDGLGVVGGPPAMVPNNAYAASASKASAV